MAWYLPARPHEAGPDLPDGRLNSLSFAPYRPGQSPFSGIFPSEAQVDADLALLAPHVRAVRSYSALEGKYDLAALAAKRGLKLWQGIWLGSDRAQNRREMAAAIEAANRYPDTVERVIVGNEVLLRRDLPVDELIADIEQVRRAVRQPVTYADVWEFWRQFPQVAEHVDIVTIHLLPYWEDVPTGIDRAIAHVDETYRRMAALFPGKPIAVGETGWPGHGRWRADAAPGLVNQARFIRGFVDLAQREGFDYNLVEAFDQDWKAHSEGTVGANWGFWSASRQPKFLFVGPVSANPGWVKDAALGCVLGLFLLAAGLVGTRLTPGVQLRLAVLAMVLGAALGFAAVGTLAEVFDVWEWIAGIGNLAGQALLAVLLIRRAAALLAGDPPSAPRNGAQATDAIRDLFRLKLPRTEWLFDDLSFLFLWAAAVLQLLLLFDPRYRDFPFPSFAVPLVAVLARVALGDLPAGGGGREELWAGGVLALAALGSALREGPLNWQALAWTGCALVLAAPPLRRCLGRSFSRARA
jgi:exo-beta-1,3-glucanase (GH17 family)